MATGTLDAILNFVIPFLLVSVVIGFVYTKFIDPWIMPHLRRWWSDYQNRDRAHMGREIVYE